MMFLGGPNMIMTLREAIYEKVRGLETDRMLEVISGSIGDDEKALPGLGVLFEIIWENSDDEIRKKLANTLCDHLPEM
jgi:small acid-soluble spore protein I (minor)